MPVRFDALDGVVRVIIELVQHHLVHFIVYWHRFLTRKQPFRPLVLLLLEPRVSSDFFDAIPLLWVRIKYLRNKVGAVLRQELWDFVVTSQDLLVEIGCFGVLEREESANHGVQDNATAPNIWFKAEILFTSNHFWCRIARWSASGFQLFAASWSIHITKTEIDYFQGLVEIKEKILGF